MQLISAKKFALPESMGKSENSIRNELELGLELSILPCEPLVSGTSPIVKGLVVQKLRCIRVLASEMVFPEFCNK